MRAFARLRRRRSRRRWPWSSDPRSPRPTDGPAGGAGAAWSTRRLLCPHDLARIVVVAEPPGPGSEAMGRRAAGRSWGGALLCFGAVGQGGGDQLGRAPVPDSRPGATAAASVLTPLSHLFGPAAIIAVVLLTVVSLVARNRSVLPVAAAAVAGRRRMGAGERGEGHRRPPPALRGDGRCGAAPAPCARHELSLQPHRCRPGGSHRARAVPGPATGRGGDRTPAWWAGPGST